MKIWRPIRSTGHQVYLPTIAGNRPGYSKSVGLKEAIQSIVDYFNDNQISDAVLLGHSYGGMVITGVADKIPDLIHRLIYWNAFMPNNGESLNDLVPQMYVDLPTQIGKPDGSVELPFPIWRESFINDVDAELAQSAYDKLNPHPNNTFKEPISLSKNPAEIEIPKSYINGTEDTALPQSLLWLRVYRKSWVCSGLYRHRGVMNCVSPIPPCLGIRFLKPTGIKDFCPRLSINSLEEQALT